MPAQELMSKRKIWQRFLETKLVDTSPIQRDVFTGWWNESQVLHSDSPSELESRDDAIVEILSEDESFAFDEEGGYPGSWELWRVFDESSTHRVRVFDLDVIQAIDSPVWRNAVFDKEAALGYAIQCSGYYRYYHGPGRGFGRDPVATLHRSRILVHQSVGLDI